MEASNHQVHTYHSLQNALGVSSIKLWTCPVYVPDVTRLFCCRISTLFMGCSSFLRSM